MADISILGLSIMLFVCAIVGLSLAPTIAQSVGTATAADGTDSATDALLGLSTIMYSLLVFSCVVGITYYTLVVAGFL